jgi:hypothetical protein
MEQLLSAGPAVDRAIITGGCGFVGSRCASPHIWPPCQCPSPLQTDPVSALCRRLADALHTRGTHVILYDLTPPLRVLPEGMSWVQGNVLDYDTLEKAFTDFGGVTAVFHVAAYGMSGEEQFNDEKVMAVNVQVGSPLLGWYLCIRQPSWLTGHGWQYNMWCTSCSVCKAGACLAIAAAAEPGSTSCITGPRPRCNDALHGCAITHCTDT